MVHRITVVATLAATAIILGVHAPAHAIIVVTPKPGQSFPTPPVQLVEQKVDVTLSDRAAEVSVECTYYNSFNSILEGTWIFPLPPEAAVDKFSMFVGGEEIKAELLDAVTARNIYETIVRQTRDPALLEYVDRQLLRARIYPINPMSEATVKLYYTHPLAADFGVTDFVFPILDEVWASNVWNDPARRAKSQMTITINTLSPLKAVTSPTHDADIDHDTDHKAIVHCAPEVLRQAGDFHLLCTFDTREIAAQFLTTENEDGKFFMGIIAPGNGEELAVLAKDVVFCIDHSGSMQGDKIRQARDALKFCLNSLNPDDRFGLVLFNDGVDIMTPRLVDAYGAGKTAALKHINAITADGGTYIEAGLASSLVLFEKNDRPRYLVFLTDGLPTVGATDPATILNQVKLHNEQKARVFTFGVGFDLNAALLNDIAHQNHGFSSYVAPEEDVEIAVSNFFRKVSRPVLADCTMEFSGDPAISDIYPREIADVFAGTEIVMLGRFTGSGEVTAQLAGARAETPVTHTFNAEFSPDKDRYPFVAKLWAGRRIGHLLESMRLSGESPELKEEIVRLSKRYGIMTPYTSFLAAPEEIARQMMRDDPSLQSMDASGVPQGASSGTQLVPVIVKGRSELIQMNQTTTKRDIESSKLQAGDYAHKPASEENERRDGDYNVAGKRFSLLGGIWTDWDIAAGQRTPADTISIKPYSEAYFHLTRNRQIAEILSLGDRVSFLWRNTLIRLEENGATEWNNKWAHLL